MALFCGGEGVGAAAEPERGGTGAVEPVEAGEILDVAEAEAEGVVAGSGEIEGLNRGEARGVVGVGGALVGHIGQVEAQAAAIEGDGVDTAATINAGQLGGVAATAEGTGQGREVGGVEYKAIVAGTTEQHISATVAGDGVVARIANEVVIGGGTDVVVVAGGAQLIDRGL